MKKSTIQNSLLNKLEKIRGYLSSNTKENAVKLYGKIQKITNAELVNIYSSLDVNKIDNLFFGQSTDRKYSSQIGEIVGYNANLHGHITDLVNAFTVKALDKYKNNLITKADMSEVIELLTQYPLFHKLCANYISANNKVKYTNSPEYIIIQDNFYNDSGMIAFPTQEAVRKYLLQSKANNDYLHQPDQQQSNDQKLPSSQPLDASQVIQLIATSQNLGEVGGGGFQLSNDRDFFRKQPSNVNFKRNRATSEHRNYDINSGGNNSQRQKRPISNTLFDAGRRSILAGPIIDNSQKDNAEFFAEVSKGQSPTYSNFDPLLKVVGGDNKVIIAGGDKSQNKQTSTKSKKNQEDEKLQGAGDKKQPRVEKDDKQIFGGERKANEVEAGAPTSEQDTSNIMKAINAFLTLLGHNSDNDLLTHFRKTEEEKEEKRSFTTTEARKFLKDVVGKAKNDGAITINYNDSTNAYSLNTGQTRAEQKYSLAVDKRNQKFALSNIIESNNSDLMTSRSEIIRVGGISVSSIDFAGLNQNAGISRKQDQAKIGKDQFKQDLYNLFIGNELFLKYAEAYKGVSEMGSFDKAKAALNAAVESLSKQSQPKPVKKITEESREESGEESGEESQLDEAVAEYILSVSHQSEAEEENESQEKSIEQSIKESIMKQSKKMPDYLLRYYSKDDEENDNIFNQNIAIIRELLKPVQNKSKKHNVNLEDPNANNLEDPNANKTEEFEKLLKDLEKAKSGQSDSEKNKLKNQALIYFHDKLIYDRSEKINQASAKRTKPTKIEYVTNLTQTELKFIPLTYWTNTTRLILDKDIEGYTKGQKYDNYIPTELPSFKEDSETQEITSKFNQLKELYKQKPLIKKDASSEEFEIIGGLQLTIKEIESKKSNIESNHEQHFKKALDRAKKMSIINQAAIVEKVDSNDYKELKNPLFDPSFSLSLNEILKKGTAASGSYEELLLRNNEKLEQDLQVYTDKEKKLFSDRIDLLEKELTSSKEQIEKYKKDLEEQKEKFTGQIKRIYNANFAAELNKAFFSNDEIDESTINKANKALLTSDLHDDFEGLVEGTDNKVEIRNTNQKIETEIEKIKTIKQLTLGLQEEANKEENHLFEKEGGKAWNSARVDDFIKILDKKIESLEKKQQADNKAKEEIAKIINERKFSDQSGLRNVLPQEVSFRIYPKGNVDFLKNEEAKVLEEGEVKNLLSDIKIRYEYQEKENGDEKYTNRTKLSEENLKAIKTEATRFYDDIIAQLQIIETTTRSELEASSVKSNLDAAIDRLEQEKKALSQAFDEAIKQQAESDQEFELKKEEFDGAAKEALTENDRKELSELNLFRDNPKSVKIREKIINSLELQNEVDRKEEVEAGEVEAGKVEEEEVVWNFRQKKLQGDCTEDNLKKYIAKYEKDLEKIEQLKDAIENGSDYASKNFGGVSSEGQFPGYRELAKKEVKQIIDLLKTRMELISESIRKGQEKLKNLEAEKLKQEEEKRRKAEVKPALINLFEIGFTSNKDSEFGKMSAHQNEKEQYEKHEKKNGYVLRTDFLIMMNRVLNELERVNGLSVQENEANEANKANKAKYQILTKPIKNFMTCCYMKLNGLDFTEPEDYQTGRLHLNIEALHEKAFGFFQELIKSKDEGIGEGGFLQCLTEDRQNEVGQVVDSVNENYVQESEVIKKLNLKDEQNKNQKNLQTSLKKLFTDLFKKDGQAVCYDESKQCSKFEQKFIPVKLEKVETRGVKSNDVKTGGEEKINLSLNRKAVFENQKKVWQITGDGFQPQRAVKNPSAEQVEKEVVLEK